MHADEGQVGRWVLLRQKKQFLGMYIWLFVCVCVSARARVCVCVCECERARALVTISTPYNAKQLMSNAVCATRCRYDPVYGARPVKLIVCV
jgi:hypothetical protein